MEQQPDGLQFSLGGRPSRVTLLGPPRLCIGARSTGHKASRLTSRPASSRPLPFASISMASSSSAQQQPGEVA